MIRTAASSILWTIGLVPAYPSPYSTLPGSLPGSRKTAETLRTPKNLDFTCFAKVARTHGDNS